MAFLTLAAQTIDGYNQGGSVAYVRVFASQSFYEATDGTFVQQGNSQQISSFCAEYTASVSGTVVTLPEIVLASTTDSNVPNAVYTIILYNAQNVLVQPFLASQWFVDPEYYGAPADTINATWEQFTLSNQAFGVIPNITWPGPFWNVEQTKQYVNSLVGDGTTPFASAAIAGKTRLDVDPVLSTAPIAIGLNSPSTGTGDLVRKVSPVLTTPNIGAPSFGVLSSCTGLPITTGVAGLGSNVSAFLATPSSTNLRAAVTDESGTGALIFGTNPALVNPTLGTPASVTLTNATGLPISTGISGLGTGVATFLGTPSSANLLATLTTKTGTGSAVFGTAPTISGATLSSPTLSSAVLGTPSSGNLSNCTSLPIASGVSGLGSNVATFLATPSSSNLAAAVTGESGTGALIFGTAPTITNGNFVTPTLGASVATSVTATGLIKSTGTAGIGYGAGAGGAITQITSRATGVTLDKICGAITLFSAAGSATPASLTVTNSTCLATDIPYVVQKSGTDLYEIFVTAVAAGSFRITFFTTGGTTTEQPVFSFEIRKAVAS